MASNTPYPVREAPPKALINLLLMGGLAGIAYAIITQKLLIAAVIVCLPIVVTGIGYGFLNPYFVYLLYATYAFFFTTISRYTLKVKLSIGLDILLGYFSFGCFLPEKDEFQIKRRNQYLYDQLYCMDCIRAIAINQSSYWIGRYYPWHSHHDIRDIRIVRGCFHCIQLP